MSQTYTVDEAKEMTGKFILAQAEVLRKELREARRTNQLLCEHV